MEKVIQCPYCTNKNNQGVFVGNVCSPCYTEFKQKQENEIIRLLRKQREQLGKFIKGEQK